MLDVMLMALLGFVFGLSGLALGWYLVTAATLLVVLLAIWRIVPRREE